MKTGTRLKQVIKHFGLKQVDFADSLGISANYLSMVINGKKELSDAMKLNITKVIPSVNLDFIETGEGEIEIDSTNEPTEIYQTKLNPNNIEEVAKFVNDNWEKLIKDRLFKARFEAEAGKWVLKLKDEIN